MGYDPFLIAPFTVGLDLDIEPWLLPQDAFETIENAHLKHGYVEKRNGFTELAQAAHTDSNYAISNISQAYPGVVTITSASSTLGSGVADIVDGTRIQINYVVGMTQVNGVQYLANNVGGTTFELQDLNGNNVDTSVFNPYVMNGYVSVFPGDRITGIGRCYDSEGLRDTIVWDDKRGYYFNKTNGSLEPLDLGDILASGETDFIHWNNWSSVANTNATPLNRIYFTNGLEYTGGMNGQNGIRFYSCSTAPTAPQAISASLFRPTINGLNTIDGCKFVFPLKQRLFLLATIEGGTNYPQRLRWCASRRPGTPGMFTDEWNDNVPGLGGFIDAPTSEQVVTARYLQDSIIVFFTNSVWQAVPTTDPRLPVRWIKINSFRGADARMGSQEYDRYVLGVGTRGITATDSNETRRVDNRIEDFVTDLINGDEFGRVFVNRNFQLRRTWILYPGLEAEVGSEENDNALILDEESGAYSTYIIAMNVLGHGQTGFDLQLDDFPDTANSLNPRHLPVQLDQAGDFTLQTYHTESTDELFLGGDVNGFVYRMDFGIDDNGTPIDMTLKSAAWNPYKEQGIQCELGYVDFYLDASENTYLEVSFFKNNMPDPYQTVQINGMPDVRERSEIEDVQPLDPSTNGYRFGSSNHGLTTGELVYLYQIKGPTFLNSNQYQVSVINEDVFEINQDFSSNGTAITSITQANPGVVTAASHPFSNGDVIIITGADMTEVNNNVYSVANVTLNTFELEGVDTTSFTAYTTGGVVFPYYLGGGIVGDLPMMQGKIWKRAYGGGVGYWHQIEITQENNNSPLRLSAFLPHFKRIGTRII